MRTTVYCMFHVTLGCCLFQFPYIWSKYILRTCLKMCYTPTPKSNTDVFNCWSSIQVKSDTSKMFEARNRSPISLLLLHKFLTTIDRKIFCRSKQTMLRSHIHTSRTYKSQKFQHFAMLAQICRCSLLSLCLIFSLTRQILPLFMFC